MEPIIIGTTKTVGTQKPDILPRVRKKPNIVELTHVTDFWQETKGRLTAGNYVSITGTLSQYAPFVIGPPKMKRAMHMEFRRRIPDLKRKIGPTFVDSLLAYSAGQMVFRLDPDYTPTVHLGLYHSIVRNSISVFVDKDYYSSLVKDYFTSHEVIEAKVTGRLRPISMEYLKDFIKGFKEYGIDSLIKPGIIDSAGPTFAIMIDGPDTYTEISHSGESRYLDGDIWVAVRSDEETRFVSRFVDLSDRRDLHHEREELKRDVEASLEKDPKGGNVIAEFDQINLILDGIQNLNPKEIIERAIRDE